MNGVHVLINVVALLECSETLPADVSFAARTRHMVASCSSLDWSTATRTAFDVVVVFPVVEFTLILVIHVRTVTALVILEVARCANAHEA